MDVERPRALAYVRELSFNLRPRRGCAGFHRVAGSVLPRDGLAKDGNVLPKRKRRKLRFQFFDNILTPIPFCALWIYRVRLQI